MHAHWANNATASYGLHEKRRTSQSGFFHYALRGISGTLMHAHWANNATASYGLHEKRRIPYSSKGLRRFRFRSFDPSISFVRLIFAFTFSSEP
jgi:hypothetical protein